jgi:hypothetical protein
VSVIERCTKGPTVSSGSFVGLAAGEGGPPREAGSHKPLAEPQTLQFPIFIATALLIRGLGLIF